MAQPSGIYCLSRPQRDACAAVVRIEVSHGLKVVCAADRGLNREREGNTGSCLSNINSIALDSSVIVDSPRRCTGHELPFVVSSL